MSDDEKFVEGTLEHTLLKGLMVALTDGINSLASEINEVGPMITNVRFEVEFNRDYVVAAADYIRERRSKRDDYWLAKELLVAIEGYEG